LYINQGKISWHRFEKRVEDLKFLMMGGKRSEIVVEDVEGLGSESRLKCAFERICLVEVQGRKGCMRI